MPPTESKTIADLVFRSAERYGDAVAMTFPTGGADGERTSATYRELADAVSEVGAGLIDLGLEPGDRVGILAATRTEWTTSQLGVAAAGGIAVSIYATNSPEECHWVLSDSGSRGVVVEDAAQLAKVLEVRDRLPALEWAAVIEPDGVQDVDGLRVVGLPDVRARGRELGGEGLRARAEAVSPEDPYAFMYTSGTTGKPKGCVLSHGNYAWVVDASLQDELLAEGQTAYLFLPLAHAFALLIQLTVFETGATIAYWSGDQAKIIPDLAAIKPHYLPSVPRVFEKIYALAVGSQPPEQQERMKAAARLGGKVRDLRQAGQEVPAELQQPFDEADAALFANVRGLFGGNVVRANTGAAPISRDILEFFYGCGVPVLEGFGMTETATVATVNTLEEHRWGTVGKPIAGCEVRIAEDGEVLIKGGNIFRGYHNNADASFGAIEDSWLHTGDLGSVDEDGYLSIIGRKKDIIITAGGKNLTPANLENDMKSTSLVSQAVMHGDRRPYASMLLTLDPEQAAAWAQQEGLPTDVAELSRHPRVREVLQAELDAANAKYAPVEQVKRFLVLDHDLSQETGELTPTLKVKRGVINEKYAADFDALYAQ